MIELDKLVAKNKKLGSLPDIVDRVFQAMDDPNSTAAQIGKVINDDPALTARLLKLVNSPFYGFRSKIDTVFRAIALIGHNELRSVVLATSALKVFTGIPSDLVNMSLFWKRSLYTAVVARVLAAYRREKEIERYFIAGLLHDLGSLLLYLECPDEMSKALTSNQQDKIPLWEAEKQVLGYDHAEVGGALLKSWNLPPCFARPFVIIFIQQRRLRIIEMRRICYILPGKSCATILSETLCWRRMPRSVKPSGRIIIYSPMCWI